MLHYFIVSFVNIYSSVPWPCGAISVRAWGGFKEMLNFSIASFVSSVPWSCGAMSVTAWGGISGLDLQLTEVIKELIYLVTAQFVCKYISVPGSYGADYFKRNQFIENFRKQGGLLWEQLLCVSENVQLNGNLEIFLQKYVVDNLTKLMYPRARKF